MKTDQSAFLNHILDAITKIEKYIQDIDEESFIKNDLVQDGVIRQIEIIGEAVKRLSNDLKSQSPAHTLAGHRWDARQTHSRLFWGGYREGLVDSKRRFANTQRTDFGDYE